MTRRVLVTGGGRGIGAAIAERLARDAFAVVVNYRERADAAGATVDAIRAGGGVASALCFDVADRAACASAITADLEANGPYYGVVCNAGTHADAPFPGMSGDAWDRVLTTNLDGFYNVLHPLMMPMIRARQGGRIVTISSVSGVMGNRGQTNYSASKAGLIAATRSLALELAKRGITANSVAPGLIDTEMLAGAPVDEMTKVIPMRRLGRSPEVAAAVAFLCSDEASYITGQVLGVNGGLA